MSERSKNLSAAGLMLPSVAELNASSDRMFPTQNLFEIKFRKNSWWFSRPKTHGADEIEIGPIVPVALGYAGNSACVTRTPGKRSNYRYDSENNKEHREE
jgi:hypothetical protein